MPQMYSINWFMLLIYFMFIIYIFMLMLFFFKSKFFIKMNLKDVNKSFLMKWY